MMWKHSCALFCVLALLLVTNSAEVSSVSDPSTLPLIQFNDLHYVGGFRLPSGMSNGESYSIGGHPVTYNPGRNSLYIGSLHGKLAEVSIPTPVNSADVTAMPFASFLQGFYEPTEGNLTRLASSGAAVDGILVYGNRLYGTGSIFYDANNTQRVSHFSRSLQLNQASFVGWSQVWETEKSGFVSGFMAVVPEEWRTALGGPALTGQCCIPIAWRTSWGPAAFAFDPTHIGQSVVSATPLLYYDNEHPTLGSWSGSNPTYGATAHMTGMVAIAGTRSLLYFGRNGLGPYCYGNGTNQPSLDGTIGPDGAKWCYDPTSTDKGQHAYPYRYQIWAYDLNELAAVKAGRKKPWEVRPYGVWPFEFPTPEPSVKITGVGYDSERQIIYVSQMRADKDGYSNRPIIHALKVGGVAGAPLPVPDDYTPTTPSDPPPPPPAGSTKVTSISIATSKPAPQAPGTTIALTATPAGGAAPHQYQWYQHDGKRWNAITSWSTSNTYNWTPTKANTYNFSVWVRSAGNTNTTAEATQTLRYVVSGAAATTAPKINLVALVANKVAPQTTGTTIAFSATPTGGAAPYQYKWRVYNGTSWTSGSWTSSNTYSWAPTTANAGYRVEVWARSTGNTADAAEASAVMSFAITAPTSTPTTPTQPPPSNDPPPPATSAKVNSVAITASKSAPQAPGTSIGLTATPYGGAAPHQYKWWLHDGAKWIQMSSWSTSTAFTWTPTVHNPAYKVAVWVRSAGKTVDAAEATFNLSFPISSTAPPATSPPPTAGNPRATSATLTANKVSPQPRGTSITWTAAAAGGQGPHQYKFLVWNGAGWVVTRGWSTSATFTWTPSLANPYYRVSVQVRSAWNTSDEYETSATSALFDIR